MLFGCSSCCGCNPTGSYITLDAGQRVVRSLTERNNTYDFAFPPVLNHAWASVPAQVVCRWGCDQYGDEPSVEVVISRIVETTEGGPVKSLMWDAKVTSDPFGWWSPGITEWPISYRYEIELKKGIKNGSGYQSESVSRVMVPTLPANSVGNRFGLLQDEGSRTLPRTFSHWATYCRVTNRRVQGKWLVSVLLGVADIRASETFTSSSSADGIPHHTQPVYLEIYNPSSASNLPQGVRHIFDDLEVDKFGDYTSIASDVTMFSDWNIPYPNRLSYWNAPSRPLHCMLIQSGVKQQAENALPNPSIECTDPSQEYRHVQLNVCDYRKRRGHVTHAQEGKSFTKLKVGFKYPEWVEPITLEAVGEDDAALCDGTFWWSGYLPVGDDGASVRVEAAASLMTNPHLSCFSSGPTKTQISTLSFSACHGSGASGTVDAPGQATQDSDPSEDAGPITSVSLTNGGSGYAKLGRAEPTVTAEIASAAGSGAEFELMLTKAGPDECGLDYWEVSKITVVDGGAGYDEYDGVQFAVADGDTQESSASASITIAATEVLPQDIEISVTSQAGSGAKLTSVLAEAWWSPTDYRILSVTVDDGGDGYTHLDSVVVSPVNGAFLSGYGSNATLGLITANTEPTVSASVQSAGGTGATLTVTLAETVIYPPPAYSAVPAWAVQSIAVDSPGTGYAYLDLVFVSVVDGDTRSTPAGAIVTAVDANGGIVEVYVFNGGEYFKGGPITAVSVANGGLFRKNAIQSVEITDGGRYYREDASLTPYVADVTVAINQSSPSDGSGAVITATVGDDPQDQETFGKITGLAIEDGGDGYLGYLLESTSPSWPTLVGLSFRVDGRLYWHKCKFVGATFFPDNPGISEGLKLLRGQEATLEFDGEEPGYQERSRWVSIDGEIAGTSNRGYSRPPSPFHIITLQLLPDE